MKNITKYVLALALSLGCTIASASDFICNLEGRNTLSKYQLIQAYSGQPVLLSSTWVMVFILPSNHPSSIALTSLGLSPQAVERMTRSNGLVDRGIRLVQTEQELLSKVKSIKPSVGYVMYFVGGDGNVQPCF